MSDIDQISLPPTADRPVTRLLFRLIPYAGMFLLALLLWLPFSFKTTGLYEEIHVTTLLDTGNSLYFITANTQLSSHRMRPFETFFHALAYDLDHDSYFYYNFFQMLFIFGKSVVTYLLVLEFLPKRKLLAFVIAVLYMLYPADKAIFTFRAIHIHSATLAYLLAAYLLIRFCKRIDPWRWWALLSSALLLIFSLWQYQVALPLALVTPLVVLYLVRSPRRRFLLGSGVWYAAIAFAVLYGIWALGQSARGGYEVSLIEQQGVSTESIGPMFDAITLTYERQITSWIYSFGLLKLHLPVFLPYLIVGLLLFLGTAAWMIRQEWHETKPARLPWWQYAVLLALGTAVISAGMAIYLPLPTHRTKDFRIYFLSMLGSAVILGLLLYLISGVFRRSRGLVLVILTIPFFALGLVTAFGRHQQFVNYSLVQQSILEGVVSQAPQIAPDTLIVIADRTGIMDNYYTFHFGSYLPRALRYLYDDYKMEARFCRANETASSTSAICRFKGDSIRIADPTGGLRDDWNFIMPYSRVLLFTIEVNGGVRLLTAQEAGDEFGITGYDPQSRIIGRQLPYRAGTFFSCEPALSCYRDSLEYPSAHYDLPSEGEIGRGWREVDVNRVYGVSRWSIDPAAAINVNLTDETDLSVEFRLLYWLEPDVIDSLKLMINDHDIPLTFENDPNGGRIYRGTIPRSALTGYPSRTQLVLKVDRLSREPGVPNSLLGIMLNWLRIRPRES